MKDKDMSMPAAIAIVIATVSVLFFLIYTAIQDTNYFLLWMTILFGLVLIEPSYRGWQKGKTRRINNDQ